ncbi:hypothetical protein BJ138DRAFT_607934 [Hygrophoropsis aurantiaca]|uniref:Uncharacterized protein n=1 Tax=Hygrophoropsis aurantiaca TaxID=72124 RepID=A0ACB8A227_9AGAM|nr:hypothetical protein BJ138DRAFT_607934 [Hygrophoropsis aurantiaca]
MCDDFFGTCCAVALTACCDVLTGICLDFTSIQHQCAQNLCSCSRSRRLEDIDDPPDERASLVSQRQPSPHPPMQSAHSEG